MRLYERACTRAGLPIDGNEIVILFGASLRIDVYGVRNARDRRLQIAIGQIRRLGRFSDSH